MSLETGLRAALIANSAVNALVSSRVFSEQLPENPVYPAIMFSRVSTVQTPDMNEVNSLVEVRVQLDLMALTSSQVKALAVAVRGLLNGLRGDMGGQAVQRCLMQNEFDSGYFDGDNDHRRVIAEYTIWLNE